MDLAAKDIPAVTCQFMRASRVDELGDRVLRALDDGASVARAAASVGLAEQTVRSWIRRGRQDPEGRFGPFAVVVDRTRHVRPVVIDPTVPLPDRVELLRRLDEQSRNGSTRATELLLRALPADPEPLADDENWRRLMAVPSSPEAS